MLSLKEKEISDAAYWKRRRHYYIAYVYFVKVDKKVIYIGCTINPYQRSWDHIRRLNLSHYRITYFGPFKMALAWRIEDNEIAKRKKSKHLLNKKSKKYDYDKEFSIENFKRTSISFIKEKGKRKEVVRKYTYKQHH